MFNETPSQMTRSSRSWRLGDVDVSEVSEIVHLGLSVTKNLSPAQQVSDICRKLKSSYFGVVNVGLHVDGFHPLTGLKVYKSVVLPRALYGSETPCNCPLTLELQLERAHRFCLKR